MILTVVDAEWDVRLCRPTRPQSKMASWKPRRSNTLRPRPTTSHPSVAHCRGWCGAVRVGPLTMQSVIANCATVRPNSSRAPAEFLPTLWRRSPARRATPVSVRHQMMAVGDPGGSPISRGFRWDPGRFETCRQGPSAGAKGGSPDRGTTGSSRCGGVSATPRRGTARRCTDAPRSSARASCQVGVGRLVARRPRSATRGPGRKGLARFA